MNRAVVSTKRAYSRDRESTPLVASAAAGDFAKTLALRGRQAGKKEIQKFREEVLGYWKKHGRHSLPWRKTKDPYRILVSEIMLQQTQVPRVIDKYKEFLRVFPTVRALARAKLSDVLKMWSGLGYNRRGKYLHDAAKVIVTEHRGNIKNATMHTLPGVGPYTRAAVRAFAFNEPHTMVETNIRAAYIHHFFQAKKRVDDAQLSVLIEKGAHGQDPRNWHSALMDYGAHIKKLHDNPTRKSKHYVMQSKFEGSLRQVRGAVLKVLNAGSHGDLAISQKLSFDEKMVRDALAGLARDGLVTSEKGSWRIA
ncbi:A/G-specific adenine glycosylase [Candidatus Kaiserbacteria bacterium]|nr:A/G-specific adenine glycosylase [Candidatus Kaiserbacteria bacterium]